MPHNLLTYLGRLRVCSLADDNRLLEGAVVVGESGGGLANTWRAAGDLCEGWLHARWYIYIGTVWTLHEGINSLTKNIHLLLVKVRVILLLGLHDTCQGGHCHETLVVRNL